MFHVWIGSWHASIFQAQWGQIRICGPTQILWITFEGSFVAASTSLTQSSLYDVQKSTYSECHLGHVDGFFGGVKKTLLVSKQVFHHTPISFYVITIG